MIPVLALVGRPNVGKSTLFNRLTGSRDAIVADFPGLTRDRQYGEATIEGHRCLLIDTGGLSEADHGVDALMAQQSWQAVQEASAVLFMVDARAGLTPTDEWIAKRLRSLGKPFYLVVNKVDGVNVDTMIAEFYRLGVETIYPITATHGRGIQDLMESVLGGVAPEEEVLAASDAGIKVTVVGRPNVGKSTLVNRMLGEERVVASDLPGTTRDSIYVPYERNGKQYTLIDTAGVRRRGRVTDAVEKFSIVKTLQAIDDAHVVVLLIDASEGLVDQDMHLMGQVLDSGKGLVMALNKWDGLSVDQKQHAKSEMDRRLQFLDYVDVHYISALHGTGVGHLYRSIDKAYASTTVSLSTPKLTRILEDAVAHYAPPAVQGRRIKLRYAHQGGVSPLRIVIHGNQTDHVPANYKRYLEKTFRTVLRLRGAPILLQFRTGENPYEGKKNVLTARQQDKRRRLMKHVKSKKRS